MSRYFSIPSQLETAFMPGDEAGLEEMPSSCIACGEPLQAGIFLCWACDVEFVGWYL